jgi:hypothetical protein
MDGIRHVADLINPVIFLQTETLTIAAHIQIHGDVHISYTWRILKKQTTYWGRNEKDIICCSDALNERIPLRS